ncbi:MAG: bifunctional phosphopantothenoylcysteine decarboxylase/phosphopantothenate--cysteine ligase CoaBC [bacterium]|nr:bifunctional phosphopantothenoylcysteine decarboxylase/phosphopantothenate--cysteine ligase CoaBC [bacterium]
MKIVLGITGGIACYKALDIARKLYKAGYNVYPVMTRSASELLRPKLLHALVGNRPVLDLFDDPDPFAHINLARDADLLAVVPATANIIAKTANGIADDALSTTILATNCPKLFAPAMNVDMLANPVTQENLKRLKGFGYGIIEPEEGLLACDDIGKGRLASVEVIYQEILLNAWENKNLTGCRILITAGGTEEQIDPARMLTNYSTGTMGHTLAQFAARRGATVTLVSTRSAGVVFPSSVDVIPVKSADDMRAAVLAEIPANDVIIMAAAVADFRPRKQSYEKIKKASMETTLELERNPDILAELGQRKSRYMLIGFAAETGDIEDEGRRKLEEKNADIIVANKISGDGFGFGDTMSEAVILDRDGEAVYYNDIAKAELAEVILDRVKDHVQSRGEKRDG